jgi:thiopurine S-methyltransferase
MRYDQSKMNGPPFSVARSDVESLFASCEQIEQLESQSIIDAEPRFRERGLSELREEAYWIVRQSSARGLGEWAAR